jgi:hypothetical protein
VELAPGQELTGIDIHLARERRVTIAGTVTGIPANPDPSLSVTVLLSAISETSSYTHGFPVGPEGRFTLPGLTPGRYRLVARIQSPEGVVLQSAAIEVRPENADENGVTMPLQEGETVSGTLEIEADSAKTAPPEKLVVRLESTSGMYDGRIRSAEVGEKGAFHLDQVFPDKLRVRVMPMPENAYIKSIKIGGAEAPGGLLDLSHGAAGATLGITLSRNGGQVEGTVLGEDGEPLSGSLTLVILAATPDNIGEEIIRPAAGGKFKFTGIHPGKYRLLAVDPRQLSGESDFRGAVKAFFPNVPEIEIHESDRLAKDVKLTTSENASAKQ